MILFTAFCVFIGYFIVSSENPGIKPKTNDQAATKNMEPIKLYVPKIQTVIIAEIPIAAVVLNLLFPNNL